MATIPHVIAGEVARAAEQNALIDQVNTNTTDISAHTSDIANNDTLLGEHGSRITALESKPDPEPLTAKYFGVWSDAGGGRPGVAAVNGTGGGGAGVKLTDINTVVETPVGCSLSNGTFTADHAGKWMFNVSAQYLGGNSAIRALFVSKGNVANSPTGVKYGLIGAPSMDSQATTATVNLTAGQQVSVYFACWTSGGDATIYVNQGNTLTATYLGP